ncbi:uncharacterized protein LOC124844074, partial [Vigna umbellata]|uniref:uncharacterized protein LOC124844074 n=1 Tax=Vigna umbellata TaxID=87088 RepID=UPI001F5F269B
MGHTTKECVTLKDKIQELIHAGQLKKYVRVDCPHTSIDQPSPRRTNLGNPRGMEGSEAIGPTVPGRKGDEAGVKRIVRTLQYVHSVDDVPPITFSNEEFHAPDPDQDDPMVITAEIARYDVSKVLVDQGSSVNILYWKTFQQMEISEDLIVPYNKQIVRFTGERVDTRGYVHLRKRLGTGRSSEEKRVEYEALVAGLELARDIGAQKVICCTDSQLVVGQMNGDFQ